MLCDVCDEFQTVDGQPFLSESLTFGVMINIDWFLPYKHVMLVLFFYMVCLNLPGRLHFKRENVLLIGILPGPSESSHDINTFLQPLVNELLNFWTGVNMPVHGHETDI